MKGSPQFALGPQMDLEKRVSGARPYVSYRRPSEKRDYLLILFWGLLIILAFQAILSSSVCALAWVGLGVMTLLFKQKLSIRPLLVIEAPIFLGIISYSGTTLYLARATGAFDLANDPSVTEAMWVAWGGMLCFLIGLILVLKTEFFRGDTSMAPIRITERQALIIYLFGLFCNEVLSRVVPFSLGAVVYTFGCGAPIGLFIILQLNVEEGSKWFRSWKFYLWLVALVEWSFRSVLGGIFGNTLLILLIFLSQYARKSKLLLVGIFVAGALIAPLLQNTKSDFRMKISAETAVSESTLMEVTVENFTKVFLDGDANVYLQGIQALAERLCTFDVWFRVKRHLDDQQDFAHGQTIKDAFIAGIIPRVIWTDKPITGGDSSLAVKYADLSILRNTSIGVGSISEFYINEGTWAVMIGMLGLGVFGGAVLNRGWFNRIQPLSTILALYTFSSLIRPEVNLVDLFGGMLRMLFLWWVLQRWILWQNRKNEWYARRSAKFLDPGKAVGLGVPLMGKEETPLEEEAVPPDAPELSERREN